MTSHFSGITLISYFLDCNIKFRRFNNLILKQREFLLLLTDIIFLSRKSKLLPDNGSLKMIIDIESKIKNLRYLFVFMLYFSIIIATSLNGGK